jgi:hypothetical protein
MKIVFSILKIKVPTIRVIITLLTEGLSHGFSIFPWIYFQNSHMSLITVFSAECLKIRGDNAALGPLSVTTKPVTKNLKPKNLKPKNIL